jgi:hypothetical protein
LLCGLAEALDADELLFLAQRIPDRMKRRILERPDAFRKLTELDDEGLDRVLAVVDAPDSTSPSRRKAT